VSAPRLISSTKPQYTQEARGAAIQGTVTLWVIVLKDGCTHDIRVVRSLEKGLDAKAIEAVRCWKYEPAKKDGSVVRVEMNVEVIFKLSADK
jgi:protein TonB